MRRYVRILRPGTVISMRLLADTQSPVSDTRKSAELQLLRLYPNETFPLSLAAIASHDSVPTKWRCGE
ncbi:uncharacterized protein BO88DRAFT_112626 [Aspergillus vadensis CBS 113365]|uniref:Uncharacterized protein n=1 Tax=Aspergillus vadensis (strain CBS 113365 / IMI 142717 / IBT 24658) TaxID=1448311 RepID=A0A319B440_ASPVC|nr:hypothetical protein BO88DRAFT_112626 [Aspergillus vadensis CBS 113365]PYH66544.1 hypothetical protein BO88DRAFT_112626 [Aspergillus vadensis CBS 113365]